MKRVFYYLFGIALILGSCEKEDVNQENFNTDMDEVSTRKAGKVDVCHYDSVTDSWKAINISGNAVKGHLKHGDYLGSCKEPVPTDGLIAYYPFNGNANDESGNGYDGIVDGATVAEDRYGNSASSYGFDGINDYVSSPIDMGSIFDVGDAITFSLWMNSGHTNLNYYDFILGGVPGGGPIFFASVKEGDQGKIRVRLYGGGHGISDSSVLDGNWHHIVWGVDSSGIPFFYVDGVIQSSPPSIGSYTGETELVFGSRLDGSLPFKDFYTGYIDDIRIYDRGLSNGDVQILYNE